MKLWPNCIINSSILSSAFEYLLVTTEDTFQFIDGDLLSHNATLGNEVLETRYYHGDAVMISTTQIGVSKPRLDVKIVL